MKPCVECGETTLLTAKAKLAAATKMSLYQWRGEAKCQKCGHFVLTYALYETKQDAVDKAISLWDKEE